MDHPRALLDEIAGMVADRERRTIDLLMGGSGLTDAVRWQAVEAHVEQRRRHQTAHGVPALTSADQVRADRRSLGWGWIATAATVGSCLEAVLLTEVISWLGAAVDELGADLALLGRMLAEEPQLPDSVWRDGSPAESATAVHDSLRWVHLQLLERRGVVATLGRDGTSSAFAAMLDAYPALHARLGPAPSTSPSGRGVPSARRTAPRRRPSAG